MEFHTDVEGLSCQMVIFIKVTLSLEEQMDGDSSSRRMESTRETLRIILGMDLDKKRPKTCISKELSSMVTRKKGTFNSMMETSMKDSLKTMSQKVRENLIQRKDFTQGALEMV